ncbi:MAG: hypothetical protein D6757_01425 [Alphaproteobacteria bacterium]|nr:MAG: hypothetical protein D6757_01425 [Alphaproteobacteria bacterium]
MADILTFRHREWKRSEEPRAFLQDGNDTLPFRTTPEGRTDLGEVEIPIPEASAAPVVRDWSNQELADLFRVKRLLDAAGVPCDIDRGLSDEGDPWFVFCDGDGEVFIHLSRIDGLYVLDSPNIRKPLRGTDFNGLIADFTNRAVPRTSADQRETVERRVIRLERGGKLFLHPSMLLAALIWTLYVASDDLVLLKPEDEAPETALDALIAFGESDADADEGEALPPLPVELADAIQTTTDGEGRPLSRDLLHDGRIELQLKDLHGLQGMALAPNGYALGLNTIAIAMGIMSESLFVDDRQKILDALQLLELADTLPGDGTGEDTPQDAGTDQILTFFNDLGRFLAEMSGRQNTGEDATRQMAEAETAPVQDGAAEKSPEINIAVGVEITAEKAQTPSAQERAEDTAAVQTASPQELSLAQLETEEAPATLENSDGPAGSSLSSIPSLLQALESELQEFAFDRTEVFATFDPEESAYAEAGIVDLVIEPEVEAAAAPTPSQLPEFDEHARAFVDYLLSKPTDVDMITLGTEVIIIDPSVISSGADGTYVRSWDMDNVIISVVGLRGDFQDFDLLVA